MGFNFPFLTHFVFLTLLNCPQIKIFLTVLKSARKGLLEIVKNLYRGISGSREIPKTKKATTLRDTLYIACTLFIHCLQSTQPFVANTIWITKAVKHKVVKKWNVSWSDQLIPQYHHSTKYNYKLFNMCIVPIYFRDFLKILWNHTIWIHVRKFLNFQRISRLSSFVCTTIRISQSFLYV